MLPLITMIATFLAVPVIVREGGASGWAAVAIAQGVGTTAALVVSFGWMTVGPADVARRSLASQGHLYWISSVMRSILFVAAAPSAVGLSLVLVTPEFSAVAVLVGAAYTAQGLSPGWFLIGQGRPMAIALMETGPRAAAQLLSVAAVATSHDIIWYGWIILTSELAISAFGFIRLARLDKDEGRISLQLGKQFRRQWPLAAAAVVGAGYTRAAVPIISLVAYPSVATFAALDRVQLIGRSGLRPLVSFFQGWVVRDGDTRLRQNAHKATFATITLGVAGGALIAVGLPRLDTLLFADAIDVTELQAWLLGLSLVLVAGSFSTGLYYLVPQGAVRILSASSIVGSVIGIPLILALTPPFGASGAMMAIVLAEAFVLAWQVLFIVRNRI